MRKLPALLLVAFVLGFFVSAPAADAKIVRVHHWRHWHHHHFRHHHHHHAHRVFVR